MYICIGCGNAHQKLMEFAKFSEPVCKCCGKELITVDEGIARIIVFLNQKGLETLHSCEGHYCGEGNFNFEGNVGYISFHNKNNDLEKILADIPDEIDDYTFSYELSVGPRSFENREFIPKFILRWEYKNDKIIDSNYNFMINKIKMLEKLDTIFKNILKGE